VQKSRSLHEALAHSLLRNQANLINFVEEARVMNLYFLILFVVNEDFPEGVDALLQFVHDECFKGGCLLEVFSGPGLNIENSNAKCDNFEFDLF
jgi:hypothetical protein